MRQEITPSGQDLSVAGDAASATSWTVLSYREKTISIAGTFTGTVNVEGTIDGTSWAAVAAPVTAPAILTIAASVDKIRIRGSSWSSGTATARFSGFNSRTS